MERSSLPPHATANAIEVTATRRMLVICLVLVGGGRRPPRVRSERGHRGADPNQARESLSIGRAGDVSHATAQAYGRHRFDEGGYFRAACGIFSASNFPSSAERTLRSKRTLPVA